MIPTQALQRALIKAGPKVINKVAEVFRRRDLYTEKSIAGSVKKDKEGKVTPVAEQSALFAVEPGGKLVGQTQIKTGQSTLSTIPRTPTREELAGTLGARGPAAGGGGKKEPFDFYTGSADMGEEARFTGDTILGAYPRDDIRLDLGKVGGGQAVWDPNLSVSLGKDISGKWVKTKGGYVSTGGPVFKKENFQKAIKDEIIPTIKETTTGLNKDNNEQLIKWFDGWANKKVSTLNDKGRRVKLKKNDPNNWNEIIGTASPVLVRDEAADFFTGTGLNKVLRRRNWESILAPTEMEKKFKKELPLNFEKGSVEVSKKTKNLTLLNKLKNPNTDNPTLLISYNRYLNKELSNAYNDKKISNKAFKERFGFTKDEIKSDYFRKGAYRAPFPVAKRTTDPRFKQPSPEIEKLIYPPDVSPTTLPEQVTDVIKKNPEYFTERYGDSFFRTNELMKELLSGSKKGDAIDKRIKDRLGFWEGEKFIDRLKNEGYPKTDKDLISDILDEARLDVLSKQPKLKVQGPPRKEITPAVKTSPRYKADPKYFSRDQELEAQGDLIEFLSNKLGFSSRDMGTKWRKPVLNKLLSEMMKAEMQKVSKTPKAIDEAYTGIGLAKKGELTPEEELRNIILTQFDPDLEGGQTGKLREFTAYNPQTKQWEIRQTGKKIVRDEEELPTEKGIDRDAPLELKDIMEEDKGPTRDPTRDPIEAADEAPTTIKSFQETGTGVTEESRDNIVKNLVSNKLVAGGVSDATYGALGPEEKQVIQIASEIYATKRDQVLEALKAEHGWNPDKPWQWADYKRIADEEASKEVLAIALKGQEGELGRPGIGEPFESVSGIERRTGEPFAFSKAPPLSNQPRVPNIDEIREALLLSDEGNVSPRGMQAGKRFASDEYYATGGLIDVVKKKKKKIPKILKNRNKKAKTIRGLGVGKALKGWGAVRTA